MNAQASRISAFAKARFQNFEDQSGRAAAMTQALHQRALEIEPHRLEYVLHTMVESYDLCARTRAAHVSGVIFACPHYGPFILPALLSSTLGNQSDPGYVFYDPPSMNAENELYDRLFAQFSERLIVLHNDSAGLLAAMRALRRGCNLGIMFDVTQNPDNAIHVPFFDRLYPAMGGTAYLSLQARVPILPVYATPIDDERAVVAFGAALSPNDFLSDDRSLSVLRMTSALFKGFQAQLEREPWHWQYWATLDVASICPADRREPEALRAEIYRRAETLPGFVRTMIPELDLALA
jgi:lauroyl/myristoyl acyltransferase